MLPASAALVASLALQAGVTRYDASLYTLGRYATDLEALAPFANASVEVGPNVRLEHEERAFTLGIAYLPRLLLIVGFPPPQVFNRASLSLALRPERDLRLDAAANACYGTYDFRLPTAGSCSLAGGTGTWWIRTGWSGVTRAGGTGGTGEPGPEPVQPIPLVPTARYMSALGWLGFESTGSRHIGVSGRMAYLMQGGADAPARTVLPLQRGPRVTAALDWTPGPYDQLTTALAGAYYTFLVDAAVAGKLAPLADAWLAHLSEAWQHRTGSQGLLRLGLGIGATGDALDFPRLVLRRLSPVVEVEYWQGLGLPAVELGLVMRVAPFVDFTSGLAYERGEVFASLALPLQRDWRLDASFSTGTVLDGLQRGQVTGTGLLTVNWAAGRLTELFMGLGSQWQEAGPNFHTSTFRQGSVFLGARMREVGQL